MKVDHEVGVPDPVWIDELAELLSMATVGADPSRRSELGRAAEWIERFVASGGGTSDRVETPAGPLVVARFDATTDDPASAPSLLLYAHYDVQPEGDASLWESPPFEPEIREGWIYARGAADDKAHLYIALRAAADLRRDGTLPVNITVLCDHEEERSGQSVLEWLRLQTQAFAAAIVLDGMLLAPGEPAFTIGSRGLVCHDVTVRTGQQDLHSGSFGNVGLNAAHVIGDAFAAVRARLDDLQIGARVIPQEDTDEWTAQMNGGDQLRLAGGRPVSQEAVERYAVSTYGRLSFDVNGIHSGEPDLLKTIIPCVASAKCSLRLAPGQDPETVCSLFEEIISTAIPENADLEIRRLTAIGGSYFRDDSAELRRLGDAFAATYGVHPVEVVWGATVPLMAVLMDLGIPTVITGFALPESGMHAPNERFRVVDLADGVVTMRRGLIMMGGSR